jgi:hypothetical protein
MSLNTAAIIFAVLGASAELVGIGMIVREIAGDRRRARELLDKQRTWKPEMRGPARRVHGSAFEDRFARAGIKVGGHQGRAERFIAELATAHNELVVESQNALEQRTDVLLKEIDSGDASLRDVLRELLRGSVVERMAGVAALGLGVILSMTASILSSLS